jgi:hypothetical protein
MMSRRLERACKIQKAVLTKYVLYIFTMAVYKRITLQAPEKEKTYFL